MMGTNSPTISGRVYHQLPNGKKEFKKAEGKPPRSPSPSDSDASGSSTIVINAGSDDDSKAPLLHTNESPLFPRFLRSSKQDKATNPWQFNTGVKVFVGIVSTLYVGGYYFLATSGSDKLTKNLMSLDTAEICGEVAALIRGPFMYDTFIKFLPPNIELKHLLPVTISFCLSLPAALAFLPTTERGLNLCIQNHPDQCDIPSSIQDFIVYYMVTLRVVSIALSATFAPGKIKNIFGSREKMKAQEIVQTLEECRYSLEKWIDQYEIETGCGYKLMGAVCLAMNVIQTVSSYSNTAKGSDILIGLNHADSHSLTHLMTILGSVSLTFFQIVGTWKGCNIVYALLSNDEIRGKFFSKENSLAVVSTALSIITLIIGGVGIVSQLESGDSKIENPYDLWSQMSLSEQVALGFSFSGAAYNSVFQYIAPLTQVLVQNISKAGKWAYSCFSMPSCFSCCKR